MNPQHKSPAGNGSGFCVRSTHDFVRQFTIRSPTTSQIADTYRVFSEQRRVRYRFTASGDMPQAFAIA